ncbi:MAG: ABC transporter ATP-binding protein [Gammaproteobacteria bacterium]|nr:ABC transporter ATP-binding protein [Gammaproteobacteria bacterium]
MQDPTHTQMPHDPLVTLEDVSFARGSRVIFDGVNIEIPRGKITAILGPSGGGKTTLLRLIGGQLEPASGKVTVFGRNVQGLNTAELFAMRRRIGMLFQSGALLTDLDVFENVAFPLREHTHLPESMIRTIVLMKLEVVGLRNARRLYPRELSGGMARRVALARAIALDPLMVLYDEPFAGQDPISMGILVRLIKQLNRALNLTSVIVSHDVIETASIADQMYLIADGKVVESGPPATMKSSATPAVVQFMQGLPDGPMPFHFPGADYLTDLIDGASP